MESQVDFSVMTDDEIDEFAKQQVALSGDSDGDWKILATAFRNSTAWTAAMQDKYWSDLVSFEAYAAAGMNYDPLTGEADYTEEE